MLLPFAEVRSGVRLLEIGAGSGLAALTAARRGARVVATDRNPFALRRLRRIAAKEGLALDVVRTDLAGGLGRFDRVLANPPYLPTLPTQRDLDRWENLAVDGGPDGCRTFARIVRSLPRHLDRSGEAFVVVSSLQDPDRIRRIRDRWLARGGTCAVVDRRRGEGETLEVWRMTRAGPGRRVTPPVRRGR